jgi:hypothetical protein
MTDFKEFDFFAVINPDGVLTPKELKEECQTENWAPVLVVRTPSDIMAPLFRDPNICIDFIKRNLPANQMVGIIGFSEVDLYRFTDQGWRVEWHTYPKMYTSRPGHSLEVGVIPSDFELHFNKNRNNMKAVL